MEQEFDTLRGTSALREDLKQALFDHAFEVLILFDTDRFHQVVQAEGQVMGDRLMALVMAFVADRGWPAYRVGDEAVALILSEKHGWDDVFFKDLSQMLLVQTGMAVTFSGGGIRHPGSEFNLFPKMADLLLTTAYQLLSLAKRRGGHQMVWLFDEARAELDHVVITRDFYRETVRINTLFVQQLEQESRTDFMTGLHNRRGFEDAFQRMVRRSRRSGRPLALIYMDSDSLKVINDSQGHDAGDRFIVTLSRVLRDTLRGSDLISRWGADEFAAVIENATRDEALAIARRLNRAISEQTEGTMSLGIFFGVPESAESALKKADTALYKVKERGKNGIELAE